MSPTRRLKIILGVIAGILAILIGVGIYGLSRPAPFVPDPTGPGASSPPGDSPDVPPAETPGLDSADATEFATATAALLYSWDTTATGRQQLIDKLLSVGDGTELNGLASDLDRHLPQPPIWDQLADLGTVQELTIDDLSEPAGWADVADDNDLPAGYTALTVTGTRHRTGTWLDEPVESTHLVSFTMFLACPPAYDSCRLLRLSEPGVALP
ncbi:MAG: hypothetical protein BGO94_12920 [Micrococcales bacterium 72-143]|nr:MAG: hypothetical protein BGO94_12920 [Micrococcales bacterium 72-143]